MQQVMAHRKTPINDDTKGRESTPGLCFTTGTSLGMKLPWEDPLSFSARHIDAHTPCVLLYSGLKTSYSGAHSFLCLDPLRTVHGAHFSDFEQMLSATPAGAANSWFGYLGYELAHDLETFPAAEKSAIALPALWMTQFATLYHFDHEARSLRRLSLTGNSPEVKPDIAASAKVAHIASNMSRAAYLEKVSQLQTDIGQGRLYQANLTRKFFGTFASRPSRFGLFRALCEASPAPYSAFIQWGDIALISSSPEKFLTVSADGARESRPIKGTAARGKTAEQDANNKTALAASEKDRAENLMIVDLMRNDFSRACVSGSVRTERLFEVSTFATLHHMDSTITGMKREDITTLDAIKSCFPPGSMTGAPKISAMRRCAELEAMQRGAYSGALGWLSGDGSCDLSVIIRTLIIQGDRFEFQVGGAIVADSDPQKEWQETLVKARGIMAVLGLDESAIAKL